MVEIPDLVSKKIKSFIDLLEKNDIKIQRAYLFGSYAKGNADKWSDIDLAIVSDKFIGNRFIDIISLRDYIYETGLDISPMPFRADDFEDSMFARDEIIKNGISII